jgi:hypothetical protein
MLMTHEVDADGRDVALCVCVVGEPEQQARLSDTRVPDEEELEQVVVSAVPAVSGRLRGRRGQHQAAGFGGSLCGHSS